MPPTSKIITLNFGNAGCGIGDATVHAMLDMHGNPPNIGSNDGLEHFFDMSDDNIVQSRSIFADLDSWVHPSVACGVATGLYKKSRVLNSNGSTNGVWTEAAWGNNRFATEVLESIRHTVEECDSLQGFIVHSSLSGGTGCGLGPRVTTSLKEEYGKYIVSYTVLPSLENSLPGDFTFGELEETKETTKSNISTTPEGEIKCNSISSSVGSSSGTKSDSSGSSSGGSSSSVKFALPALPSTNPLFGGHHGLESLSTLHGLLRYYECSDAVVVLSNSSVLNHIRQSSLPGHSDINLQSVNSLMGKSIAASLGGILFSNIATKHPIGELKRIVRLAGRSKYLALTYMEGITAKEAAPYMFDPTKSLTLPTDCIRRQPYGSCIVSTIAPISESKVESAILAGKDRAKKTNLGLFPRDMKVRAGVIVAPSASRSSSVMIHNHCGIVSSFPNAIVKPYDTLIKKHAYIHHLNISEKAKEEITRLREKFPELISSLKK